MSRYVNVEWLIKESMPLSFSVQKWVNEVQIMTAPSIDIVRCKECKKANTKNCSHSYWDSDWGEWRGYKGDDWFCADGERRPNEI